jgi:Bacterial Ig-like domain
MTPRTPLLCTLMILGACSDPPGPEPDPSDLPRSAALVSSSIVRPTAASDAAVVAGQAYVSMVPGTDAAGQRVDVRNLHNGASATALMRNGGFDPVAVQAEAGDTLSVTVVQQAGNNRMTYAVVPLFAKPTIVRTSPAMGKTDVPLNSLILVVFSQPMDSASLSDALHLRHEGVDVPGSVIREMKEGVILSARFVPASPLAPLSTYELSVSTEAQSQDGVPLDAPLTVEFTTQSSEGADEFRNLTGVYDLTSVILSSDPIWGIPTGTLQLAVLTIQHLADTPEFTGTFTDFRAVAPGEEPAFGSPGFITGFIDGSGQIVIELTFEGDQSSYWYGVGVLNSGLIEGTYGAGGHFGGTFTVERR